LDEGKKNITKIREIVNDGKASKPTKSKSSNQLINNYIKQTQLSFGRILYALKHDDFHVGF